MSMETIPVLKLLLLLSSAKLNLTNQVGGQGLKKNERNYSVEDVLGVTFRRSFKGYHMQDVDVFLDKVVEDYAGYEREIERLKAEVKKLRGY